jgi:hypothetical protein
MFALEVTDCDQGVGMAPRDSRHWLLECPRSTQESESACTGESFDQTTILPTKDDVLMGRGKGYRYNPGNMLFNGTTKFSVSACSC